MLPLRGQKTAALQYIIQCFFFFSWAPRHEGVLGSGGIAPFIFWPPHYMEVSGQLHTPTALTA